MAKNSKKSKVPTPPTKVDAGRSKEDVWLEEIQAHETDSYKALDTIRNDWPDKESILLAKVEDKLSKDTQNDVFDPILPTALMERTARVMAQNPSGKAWAVSKNDIGKNILMNHLHKYYRKNANEKWSHLIKLRLLDFYSNVYGSMFALVPWWVNMESGYIGPELFPIAMRKIRPQPGKVSPDESDWFGVEDQISLPWLAKQDPDVWNMPEIAALVREMREDGDEGDYPTPDPDSQSYVEETLYPTRPGDKPFPQIKTFTEYRKDVWITWTPKRENKEKSRPHILRVVENPYPEGMLPIVKKDAFPLIDSMIGLGDFERGKSLQFAVNSLWNLYLTGVKYSIFPPLHIDPNSVVPSSIKWGIGERWFMNRPNQDVQAMNITPRGMETFQSTYNYMQSGIYNLMGTTQVAQPAGAESPFGKTPEAIKRQAFRESSRDEWDRFMMEECIKAVYERWTALAVENIEIPQTVRIFGAEIEDLQKAFPDEDILEVFDSGKRGNVKISKEYFLDSGEDGNVGPVKFDYELDAGSTLKKDPEEEASFLQAILETILKNPQILEAIRAKKKDIDFAELLKRILMGGPVKDWDRIMIDLPTESQGVDSEGNPVDAAGNPVTPENPPANPANPVNPTNPEVPPEAGVNNGEVTPPATPGVAIEGNNIVIRDPDIAAAVRGIFPGNQIPPTNV